MSGDAYFWTLSALLQGFAALTALVGMFAVYRLRMYRDEAFRRMEQACVAPLIGEEVKLGLYGVEPTPQAWKNRLEKYCEGQTDEARKKVAGHFMGQFDKLIRIRDRIMSLTKWSTDSCGFVIFLTMSLLVADKYIRLTWHRLILLGLWFTATFALFVTVRAIVVMLAKPKE